MFSSTVYCTYYTNTNFIDDKQMNKQTEKQTKKADKKNFLQFLMFTLYTNFFLHNNQLFN